MTAGFLPMPDVTVAYGPTDACRLAAALLNAADTIGGPAKAVTE